MRPLLFPSKPYMCINNKLKERKIMKKETKQITAIIAGAAAVIPTVGKLFGDRKTYKDERDHYKEVSDQLFEMVCSKEKTIREKDATIKELKQANRDQADTIRDLIAEKEELERKLEVSNSVRGKLMDKIKKLHKLIRNLEPTGDLLKQYQRFILMPKKEFDIIKEEETVKEGI